MFIQSLLFATLLLFTTHLPIVAAQCSPSSICSGETTPSCETFAALHETCKLKLQADLVNNPQAKKLAEQAEKLLHKALYLIINAENLLKPIPVP